MPTLPRRSPTRDMSRVIAVAWVIDQLVGDPARYHPVAGFGRAAGALEQRLWKPTRTTGALHTAALVCGVAAAVAHIDGRLDSRPMGRTLLRVLVVWVTLGGRSLERAGQALADAVEAGDLERAQALAPTLVGRDPTGLDAAELCRAAVESVAENTSDAVVAPLLWAALLGPAGAAAYRAVNTLDAMIGHRSERYARFGWAAARLDDLANWPAARATALLAAACAPAVGGRRVDAWRAAWRDGAAHPSPNAGRVEGSFAGALSITLGGINHYQHGLERRPTLGSGPTPRVTDIARSIRLARLVGASSAALFAALAWAARR